MDPRRDVPRGSVWGMHTLLIAAILVLIFNSALPGGAFLYGASGFPLLDGLYAIFGQNSATELLGLLFMVGLVASFFTIIFAYGRNTFSLSRAGYFPKFLSQTHGVRKTPHVALIAGAVVGYAVFFLVWALQQQELGAQIVAALLNMAVFAAVISYIMQMVSFVLLRQKLPNIERPYRSKWGVPGAVIAGLLAATSLVAIFLNEAYRPGCVRRGDLLRARRPLLRDRRAEPSGAVAGGGVRAHAGRARASRRRSVRDLARQSRRRSSAAGHRRAAYRQPPSETPSG